MGGFNKMRENDAEFLTSFSIFKEKILFACLIETSVFSNILFIFCTNNLKKQSAWTNYYSRILHRTLISRSMIYSHCRQRRGIASTLKLSLIIHSDSWNQSKFPTCTIQIESKAPSLSSYHENLKTHLPYLKSLLGQNALKRWCLTLWAAQIYISLGLKITKLQRH